MSAPTVPRPRAAPAARRADPMLRRAVIASAVGNATEWYDYGVYAVVATYLTGVFFPAGAGSLGTMAGFAVSFVLRPLGGFFWGPIGDRFGRKSVLTATILLIAVATALIGVLPSYASAGLWAPVLLILLRVIQGFSTGGEYGGAATFLAEYAPDDKRGRYGSLLEFGALAGFLGGSAVVLGLELTLGTEAMAAWGWRVPFLLALPLGGVGLALRSRMAETPVFEECVAAEAITGTARDRLVDLVTNYGRPITVMFAMVSALGFLDYTLTTYQPTYLHVTAGLGERSRTAVMLVGELLMLIAIPIAGAWSDRVGRKPLWRVSLTGIVVLALPMYALMGHGLGPAMAGFGVLCLLLAAPLATVPAIFPAMFPTQVRYAGFAIADNAGVALFGGTAPIIADTVVVKTGWGLFPAVGLMVAAAVGLIALRFAPETAGCSLRGTDTPGVPSALELELAALTAGQRRPDGPWAVDRYVRPWVRGVDGRALVPQLPGVTGPRIRGAALTGAPR